MNVDTLAPKQTVSELWKEFSSSAWVPLVNFDDLRLIANASCNDVVFVDWFCENDYERSNPLFFGYMLAGVCAKHMVYQKEWERCS